MRAALKPGNVRRAAGLLLIYQASQASACSPPSCSMCPQSCIFDRHHLSAMTSMAVTFAALVCGVRLHWGPRPCTATTTTPPPLPRTVCCCPWLLGTRRVYIPRPRPATTTTTTDDNLQRPVPTTTYSGHHRQQLTATTTHDNLQQPAPTTT